MENLRRKWETFAKGKVRRWKAEVRNYVIYIQLMMCLTNIRRHLRYHKHLYLFVLLSLNYYIAQAQDNEVVSFITKAKVENSRLTIAQSFVIQINNRNGEDLTRISIPFTKKSKIQSLNGWIEDINGNIIRKLKNQNITDVNAVSSYSLYQDDFVRQFELRHNEYPYRVCYNYETRHDEFLEIADWDPILNIHTPTRYAELTVETPLDYPVNIYQRDVDTMTIDTVGTQVIRRWLANYSVSLKEQKMAPSLDELVPKVKIVPFIFEYGVEGKSESWSSFGNWEYRLNEGLDVLPPAEKSNLDKLIKGTDNKKEIVKRIYHYLQDKTHYVNVTIDIGGLKTYPAEYVANNKYGDCKALSNYMQALLKYAGIPSFYMNVMAGDNKTETIQQLPSPQFNHIILMVPFEKDSVWLDCTDNTAPFGYLGTFTQNRLSLIVDKQGSKLIRTPALKQNEVMESSTSLINLNLDGNVTVDYSLKSGGYTFELFKQIKNEFNAHQQDLILREIIPMSNCDINHWEINTLHRDSAWSSLLMNLTIRNFSRKLGDNIIFNLIDLNIPKFEQPSDRILPLRISYPVFKIDTTTIAEPLGHQFTNIPKPVNISSPYGNYDLQYTLENHNLKLIRRFELYCGEYSIDQYPVFFQFYKSIKDIENKKLILTKL
jgi:hypothetical protein